MVRDAMARVKEWPQGRDLFVSLPATEQENPIDSVAKVDEVS
jgi:hypothetical protein